MGLFSRIFGPKQEAPPETVSLAVQTSEKFARAIMAHYGQKEFDGDTQAKQVLTLYTFGGISAFAIQNKLSQPQAQAVALTVFTLVFGFPTADAAAKAQACITAAPDRTSHLYPTIHRGADGFLHWQKTGDNTAAEDFGDIMAHFKNFDKKKGA